MIKRTVLTVLLVALSMTAPCATLAANQDAKFYAGGSCFKVFPTYDAWIDLMRERNGRFKTWIISWRYDEERFNDAVASVDCTIGIYPSTDDTMVQAFIVKPKQVTEPLLMVLYNRGRNQGFGSVTLAQLLDFIIPLSKQGFVVAATQYRGGSRRSEGQDEFGGRDVQDVLAHAI